MSEAREAILRAVAGALSDVPATESPAASSGVATGEGKPDCDLLARRIGDYNATVTRLRGEEAIGDAISATLGRHGARRTVAPGDLPQVWRPAGVDLLYDDPPHSATVLDEVDGVVTGCALAIATTGTIVFDSGAGQGRRALTLLPDLHVCVVLAGQVVQSVPRAMELLGSARRPVTMISGPSATSDIELDRVEGVHGPRRLEVLLVD